MNLCQLNLGAITMNGEVRVFAEMFIQYLRDFLRFSLLASFVLSGILSFLTIVLRGGMKPSLRWGRCNMKRICIFTLGIWFIWCAAAHAQVSKPGKPKSESRAAIYSFYGTLAPVIAGFVLIDDDAEDLQNTAGFSLLSLGLLICPGLGHLYADNRQFGKGVVIRTVGLATVVYGASQVDLFDEEDGAGGYMIIGASLLICSAVHDMFTAQRSAREYNTRHKLSHLDLRPFRPGGGRGVGVIFTFNY
jgi:hypothetical protein